MTHKRRLGVLWVFWMLWVLLVAIIVVVEDLIAVVENRANLLEQIVWCPIS